MEFNNNTASLKRSPALLRHKYLWLNMNIMQSSLLTHPVFSTPIFLTRSISILHLQTHTASKAGYFVKILVLFYYDSSYYVLLLLFIIVLL